MGRRALQKGTNGVKTRANLNKQNLQIRLATRVGVVWRTMRCNIGTQHAAVAVHRASARLLEFQGVGAVRAASTRLVRQGFVVRRHVA